MRKEYLLIRTFIALVLSIWVFLTIGSLFETKATVCKNTGSCCGCECGGPGCDITAPGQSIDNSNGGPGPCINDCTKDPGDNRGGTSALRVRVFVDDGDGILEPTVDNIVTDFDPECADDSVSGTILGITINIDYIVPANLQNLGADVKLNYDYSYSQFVYDPSLGKYVYKTTIEVVENDVNNWCINYPKSYNMTSTKNGTTLDFENWNTPATSAGFIAGSPYTLSNLPLGVNVIWAGGWKNATEAGNQSTSFCTWSAATHSLSCPPVTDKRIFFDFLLSGVPVSCNISTIGPATMDAGDSDTLTVNDLGGAGYVNINQAGLVSDNAAITITPPLTDTSSPYEFGLNAQNVPNPTNVTLTATGTDSTTGLSCTATHLIRVSNRAASWWQVVGSDVWAQNIISYLPPSKVFNADGPGSYPGVVVYGTSFNFDGGKVSSKDWIANSSYLGTVPSNASLKAKATGVTFSSIGSLATGVPPDSKGYEWYEATGTTDLSNPGGFDFGSRKIILFVDGIVNLQSNISLTDGLGFVMLVASGDITVNPSVTNLKGIYFTDTDFVDQTAGASNDSRLTLRGSLVAKGSISLERTLNSSSAGQPAETIEYAPDQILFFPQVFRVKSSFWREAVP